MLGESPKIKASECSRLSVAVVELVESIQKIALKYCEAI